MQWPTRQARPQRPVRLSRSSRAFRPTQTQARTLVKFFTSRLYSRSGLSAIWGNPLRSGVPSLGPDRPRVHGVIPGRRPEWPYPKHPRALDRPSVVAERITDEHGAVLVEPL